MAIVVFTIALLVGFSTPQYQEFSKHSNGNSAYSIDYVAPCATGLRDTGYALAPTKFVLFKQKRLDGEDSGPVCDE